MPGIRMVTVCGFINFTGQGHQHSHGVDPAFGRRVDIDLSEDRMKKAWEAYKIRWESEEENRRILEEKKLVILHNQSDLKNRLV